MNNQQFALNFLQMRSQYLTTVDDQKRLLATAKEQLVHINALLAEQIAMQHSDEPAISMQARASTNNLELAQAAQGRELPTAVDQVASSPAAQEQTQVGEQSQQQESPIELDQTSSTVISPSQSPDEITGDTLKSSPRAKVASTSNKASQAEIIKSSFLPKISTLK